MATGSRMHGHGDVVRVATFSLLPLGGRDAGACRRFPHITSQSCCGRAHGLIRHSDGAILFCSVKAVG